MSKPPERHRLITPELEKLYIDKLIELKLKAELEKHYTKLFNDVIDLLKRVMDIFTTNSEIQGKFIAQMEKLTKNVQELHDHVFKGKDKSANYMT